MIEPSNKLKRLPSYLFTRLNQLKAEAYAKKLDVIDLGMGNPDLPTPAPIVDRLIDTVKNHPGTHRYPQAKGMPKYRGAIVQWMEKRFGVRLDPESEVLGLIGSKEGIANLCATYLDEGDTALVSEPTYPAHISGVILAGGKVHAMPLLAENKFLPDLTKVPESVARAAKLLFISYPNNPTGAVVEDPAFFKDVVAFAKKHDILVVHDNAYSEITFDGYQAPSFLQTPGAKDVGLEFYTFSKTYAMAGWRLGFAVGNAALLKPLTTFKSFVDFGAPTFIQLAGVMALTGPQDSVREIVQTYERRRNKLVEGLNKIGWVVEKPKGTMYVWARLPEPYKKEGSVSFTERLLLETGIALTPGTFFGPSGEGYVRFSLVTHDNRFHDLLLRLNKFLKPQTKPLKPAS